VDAGLTRAAIHGGGFPSRIEDEHRGCAALKPHQRFFLERDTDAMLPYMAGQQQAKRHRHAAMLRPGGRHRRASMLRPGGRHRHAAMLRPGGRDHPKLSSHQFPPRTLVGHSPKLLGAHRSSLWGHDLGANAPPWCS